MKTLYATTVLLLLFASCSSPAPTPEAPAPPLVISLSALEDFTLPDTVGFVPAYRHKEQRALAINAAKYKDQYALAYTTFAGPEGTYGLSLTTLQETDGVSTYVLYVDDEKIATVTNDSTTVDYQSQVHALGEVRLRPGTRLTVLFNSASNDKIPEGEGFAFARGRWRELTLRQE